MKKKAENKGVCSAESEDPQCSSCGCSANYILLGLVVIALVMFAATMIK
ncbi:hypothetical protein [Methanobacterium aggregans]|nr:hypothetical protein [Methanobacterium aggregans]MBP2045878.1 hypothetical protein [Methanobacterium aggregans]